MDVETLHKCFLKVLVSKRFTRAEFVEKCSSSIQGLTEETISSIYDQYQKSDTILMNEVEKVIDNKLNRLRSDFYREQIEDSVSLEQVNFMLKKVENLIQSNLDQLSLQVEARDVKLKEFSGYLSGIKPINTDLLNKATELVDRIEIQD